MKNPKSLQAHLVELLQGGQAHLDFESAVKNWPAKLQGKKPRGAAHSPWQVLEHLRIAQWDILEYTRNPKHVSPEWPAGYWPKPLSPPDKRAWSKTVNAFQADLKAMIKIIQSDSTDLLAPLAHSPDHTILREALVLADHNAYHLAELVLLRRPLGAWN